MVGIIFIGFIMTSFSLFIAEIDQNYGTTTNTTNLEVYNQLDEMKALVEEIETKSDIEEKTGITDIIGGYFTGAYKVLRLTKTSYNLFDAMSNDAIANSQLGETGQYLRIAISTSVLVLILIGVLIAAIVKWRL